MYRGQDKRKGKRGSGPLTEMKSPRATQAPVGIVPYQVEQEINEPMAA